MASIPIQIKDVYQIVNTWYKMNTGQSDIVATDTSSFIGVGERLLQNFSSNLIQDLNVLVGKTIITERPYQGKYKIIIKSVDELNVRLRKISFYSNLAEPSGAYNTDLYTNLADGLRDDAGTGNQWEQKYPKMLEQYFQAWSAWDDHYTETYNQIKLAFTSEEEFVKWFNGFIIKYMNDLEKKIESYSKAVVVDRITGIYAQKDERPETVVNMTAEYNKLNNTSYSTEEILKEHKEDFLKTFGFMLRYVSDNLTEYSAYYHDAVPLTEDGETYHILRHTPKDKQRFLFYKPIFDMAKDFTYANIFNPQFIPETSGEGVNCWQHFGTDVLGTGMQVINKPSLPDGKESDTINIRYVLGLLFDEDAIMFTNDLDYVLATNWEAKHSYRNIFRHFLKGELNDYTENSVLFIMEDE